MKDVRRVERILCICKCGAEKSKRSSERRRQPTRPDQEPRAEHRARTRAHTARTDHSASAPSAILAPTTTAAAANPTLPPDPRAPRAPSAPFAVCVGGALELELGAVDVGAAEEGEDEVGGASEGKESATLVLASAQNCCASCSPEGRLDGHALAALMQLARSLGNVLRASVQA